MVKLRDDASFSLVSVFTMYRLRITNVKPWSAEKTLWSVDVNTYIIVISKKGEPKKCLS